MSLTWIVGPYGDDFPQSNNDFGFGRRSEAVMKFTQIYSIDITLWLFNIAMDSWPIYRWFTY